MGRPYLGKVRFVVSLPPDLLKWVDETAEARGMTRADLIEKVVTAHRQKGRPRRKPPATDKPR